MTENVSFNEQEQHILINNNIQDDGTLINDKNKVDFTNGTNQLNNNNIKSVVKSKSFFRMDSIYRPRSYDRSKKVLPLSQSQLDQHKEINPDNSPQKSMCNKCKRKFKTTTSTIMQGKSSHSIKLDNIIFEIYFSYHRYM